METACAVGVDLGATNCRAALFLAGGKLLGRREIPSVGDRPPGEGVDALATLVESLLREAPATAVVRGVGIGSPGPIDLAAEVVLEAPNMPAWNRVPLRHLLEERLSIPVRLGNDANLAVFGEFVHGSGRDVDSLLGLTLGTGIGGGFVKGGVIDRGAHGMAWEVGHLYVGGEGLVCACGSIDCLELYASGEGIKNGYLRRARGEELSCRDVFAAARGGDRTAGEVILLAATLLGRALGTLQKVIDPERIVLSGGLSREREMLVEPAIAEARRNLFRTSLQHIDIKEAELGVDAGLYGAAELIFSSMPTG